MAYNAALSQKGIPSGFNGVSGHLFEIQIAPIP
jgi:hypothetical protein